jgi:hypothetical protein
VGEKQFYDAYRMLGRLQTYVWINTKGFQKIMKKYDKRQNLRGTMKELGPEFEARLEKEAFCSGVRVGGEGGSEGGSGARMKKSDVSSAQRMGHGGEQVRVGAAGLG